jgi:hypothetical protein
MRSIYHLMIMVLTKYEKSGENEMKMKYAIIYGKMKEFKTIDETKKAYAKYKEAAEKAGLKILLMGSPFGVAEDSVVVADFGGDMDKWIKFFTQEAPWTASRTDFVLEW